MKVERAAIFWSIGTRRSFAQASNSVSAPRYHPAMRVLYSRLTHSLALMRATSPSRVPASASSASIRPIVRMPGDSDRIRRPVML